MPKIFPRIIVCLLVPSFIADPIFAAGFSSSNLPKASAVLAGSTANSLFQDQALNSPDVGGQFTRVLLSAKVRVAVIVTVTLGLLAHSVAQTPKKQPTAPPKGGRTAAQKSSQSSKRPAPLSLYEQNHSALQKAGFVPLADGYYVKGTSWLVKLENSGELPQVFFQTVMGLRDLQIPADAESGAALQTRLRSMGAPETSAGSGIYILSGTLEKSVVVIQENQVLFAGRESHNIKIDPKTRILGMETDYSPKGPAEYLKLETPEFRFEIDKYGDLRYHSTIEELKPFSGALEIVPFTITHPRHLPYVLVLAEMAAYRAEDPSGFHIGETNTDAIIDGLTSLTGVPIGVLEQRVASYLGGQSFKGKLKTDNSYVVSRQLTNGKLAAPLFHAELLFTTVGNAYVTFVFTFNGRRYEVEHEVWGPGRGTVFNERNMGQGSVTITDVATGKSRFFNLWLSRWIVWYGLYPLTPKDLVEFFNIHTPARPAPTTPPKPHASILSSPNLKSAAVIALTPFLFGFTSGTSPFLTVVSGAVAIFAVAYIWPKFRRFSPSARLRHLGSILGIVVLAAFLSQGLKVFGMPAPQNPVAAAASQAAKGNRAINEVYRAGKERLDMGDAAGAIKIFESSPQRDNPKILVGRITAYAIKGNFDTARRLNDLLLNSSVATNEEKRDALFNLGALGPYSEAQNNFQKAAELGDEEAKNKTGWLDDVKNVRNFDGVSRAGTLLVRLARALPKNAKQVTFKDPLAQTMWSKFEILDFATPGFVGASNISYQRISVLSHTNGFNPLAGRRLRPDAFDVKSNGGFRWEMDSPFKLRVTTPDGVLEIESHPGNSEADTTFIVGSTPLSGVSRATSASADGSAIKWETPQLTFSEFQVQLIRNKVPEGTWIEITSGDNVRVIVFTSVQDVLTSPKIYGRSLSPATDEGPFPLFPGYLFRMAPPKAPDRIQLRGELKIPFLDLTPHTVPMPSRLALHVAA